MASRVFHARVAASCLLAPALGDQVWVVGDSVDECFVSAVLVRDEATPAELRIRGDCAWHVTEGKLSLSADQGVHLAGGTTVRVSATELEVHALKAKLFTAEMSLIGRALTATIGSIAVVGDRVEVVFQSMVQRLSRSMRQVEGTDQVRCGELDYRAQENASLRGKNTLLTASELVKIDGGQIHLG